MKYRQQIDKLFEELYRNGLSDPEWFDKLKDKVELSGGYDAIDKAIDDGIENGFPLEIQFYVIKLFRKLTLPQRWA
jgi:hypothetical protein